jgi:hypothetical protein
MCVYVTLSNKFTIKTELNLKTPVCRAKFLDRGKVLRKGSRMFEQGLLRYGLNLKSGTSLRLKHLSHTHSAQISCRRQRIFFRYLCQNPEIIRGCLKQLDPDPHFYVALLVPDPYWECRSVSGSRRSVF